MVSRLGEDEYGHTARIIMKDLGMDTRIMQRDETHPTGTVDIIFDEHNQPDYTINPNVAYDFIEPTGELLQMVEQADLLCFGTLAQRSEVSHKTAQKLIAKTTAATKLLDINLRKDCYTKLNIIESLQHADLLKLNHEEVDVLIPMLNMKAKSIVDFAKEIIESQNLKLCILTLGEHGVLTVSNQGEVVYEPGFSITLVDPCGSGDAFTAAFIDQWFAKQPLTLCCRYGNALGAIVATHSGATTPVSPIEIEAFLASPPERIVNDELLHQLSK
jgi:fructokinase